MKHVASRFLAAVLALIPGVFSIVSDPDALGIGLGAVFLLRYDLCDRFGNHIESISYHFFLYA